MPGVVTVAEFALDEGLRLLECRCSKIGRVGSHVGDESYRLAIAEDDSLVKTLGGAHRALRIEPKAACGLLLKSAGDERWTGTDFNLAFGDAGNRVSGGFEFICDCRRRGFVG